MSQVFEREGIAQSFIEAEEKYGEGGCSIRHPD